MDIKNAKDQIKNAIKAYLIKDEFGDYKIPIEKQRPIFLLGAPGIGKTAIMEQIARELGICLVSYSMTHHTRQSAIGLPFIAQKTYAGKEFNVSEYTMSEIIASVYDRMEESGIGEGILMLDEINCISETLAPAMLQFLQYKIFGGNSVPQGWVVVTAGNPPEYNKSVREFDVATLDRLKKIEVEPDYGVWKEYAYAKGIHNAIITYLDIKKDDFYSIESTVDGKNIVTARGWEDLSEMLYLYEEMGVKIDDYLIIQYLQNRKIAKEFAVYYDLYNKYKSDYQIEDILEGKNTEKLIKRAGSAKFDERLSLVGLMLERCNFYIKEALEEDSFLTGLLAVLKEIKAQLLDEDKEKALQILSRYIDEQKQIKKVGIKTGTLNDEDKRTLNKIINALEEYKRLIASKGEISGEKAFELIKKDFRESTEAFKKKIGSTKNKLDNMFLFAKEAFSGGQEILIMVTELTANNNAAAFISKFGCEQYYLNNKELLFYERQKDIIEKLEDLNLD